jgi:hypothetical protein
MGNEGSDYCGSVSADRWKPILMDSRTSHALYSKPSSTEMSLKLSKISKNELQDVIELSYRDDEELLNKYHVARFTLHEAVSSTMGMINEMAEQRKLTYYKVLYDKKPIGYVVVFEDFLYSYGINVKFRVKNVLSAWWDEVVKILKGRFITMLYKNNTRAIEFLQRRGMRILQEKDYSVTLIKF